CRAICLATALLLHLRRTGIALVNATNESSHPAKQHEHPRQSLRVSLWLFVMRALHTFEVVLMHAIPKVLTRSQGLIGCHPELRVRRAEPDVLTSFIIVIPASGEPSFKRETKSLVCLAEFLFCEPTRLFTPLPVTDVTAD